MKIVNLLPTGYCSSENTEENLSPAQMLHATTSCRNGCRNVANVAASHQMFILEPVEDADGTVPRFDNVLDRQTSHRAHFSSD